MDLLIPLQNMGPIDGVLKCFVVPNHGGTPIGNVNFGFLFLCRSIGIAFDMTVVPSFPRDSLPIEGLGATGRLAFSQPERIEPRNCAPLNKPQCSR